MFLGIEALHIAGALVLTIAGIAVVFVSAMARFLKRPSPSEAIIRIGRNTSDVFIGRAAWIVPVLHRAATMSLTTIGLTIRRAGHDALVTKDFISTNLSAEFYIRVEPAEDDVLKAARTIGIDEGHADTESIKEKSQQLLEPKLVGALRGVAAQNDFLVLHVNREHFAQEVSKALREDLGRNGFTLESVSITELTQTPLAEMRADDIFGASGRETVTNTVVQKNIAVKRKTQEEAERTAEIAREQAINVATQDRMMREGQAREEEAAIKAELAKSEAVEARDLQRQSFIAVEKARKEKTEQTAEIDRQKSVETALVDKRKTVEAAEVDKTITLTMKAKESAEADAKKAGALALREKADQEVITVKQVSEAERQKKVAVVSSEKSAEQERILADVEAYKKRVDAEASAASVRAHAEGQAQATRLEAEGRAEAVKIKAQADADAAALQAISITKLAEAQREAGLKEAEVMQRKVDAANTKSPAILLSESLAAALLAAPGIVRELVKPAERITELKVLNVSGMGGNAGAAQGTQTSQGMPMLGGALGPIFKSMMEASAMMPMLKEMMSFAGNQGVAQKLADAVSAAGVNPAAVSKQIAQATAVPAGKVAVRPVAPPAAPRDHDAT